jgi:dipeptide/tripeptide permease
MVKYNLCGCRLQKNDHVEPFMRAQWFPATTSHLQTVVMLRTLRLFHALAIQGKVNAYDFYNGLVCITDGAGLFKPKVSIILLL